MKLSEDRFFGPYQAMARCADGTIARVTYYGYEGTKALWDVVFFDDEPNKRYAKKNNTVVDDGAWEPHHYAILRHFGLENK